MTKESACEFTNNTNVDSRFIGLEANLSPFLQFISSQRVAMFSGHATQSLPVEGNEFPKIFTGYESLVGQYEFNKTKRNQRIMILDIIPKFIPNVGVYPIKENASTTIVYLGMEDHVVNYFELDNYTKGTDGFGYLNKIQNTHLLTKGNCISEDIEFSSSPILHENMYNMGTNLNVMYTSFSDVTEDAFVISTSAAKKLKSTAIKTIGIMILPDQLPRNLYGNDIEYKFFPDIGEEVREDGILCSFCTPTEDTFATDLMPPELTKANLIHDTLFCAEAGSVILDVNIYINKNKKSKIDKTVFNQVFKYIDQQNRFNQKIIEIYKKAVHDGYEISPEFNSLVTRCMSYAISEGLKIPNIPKGKIKLIKKKEPIEFIYMEIVYTHDYLLSIGDKLTDRCGHKGVVSDIRNTEDMPIDKYGNRADLIIDLLSIINRMNPGQMYEQFINWVSEFVRKNIERMHNESFAIDEIIEYVLDYIKMINPNYAELMKNTLTTPQEKSKIIEQIIDDGIYLTIPPFLNTITPSLMLELMKKYSAYPTPVTFNIRDIHGNLIKTVETKDPILIGSKYMMRLYKIPHCTSPGVSYINQFGTPVRPNALAKYNSLISRTPLRLGEDEIRYLTMTVGPSVTSRIMNLYANSIEGSQMLMHDLLTSEVPSNLNRVNIDEAQLIKTNGIIRTVQHIFSTIGVDLVNVKIDDQT